MLTRILLILGKILDSKFAKKFMKQKTPEELNNFWKNPNKGNVPEEYIFGEERSKFLVNLLKEFESKKSSKIIEIGCNVGRNLRYLQKEGYQELSGIEINTDAIILMGEKFPELSSHVTIYNEPVENCIKSFTENEFDVIFTMATLQHIHNNNKFVFDEIVRITKKILITIEDEKGISWRHFPRNYKTIFEKLGLKQIKEIHGSDLGINGFNYYARVFMKK